MADVAHRASSKGDRLAEWWADSALMVVTAVVVLAEVAFCLLPIWM